MQKSERDFEITFLQQNPFSCCNFTFSIMSSRHMPLPSTEDEDTEFFNLIFPGMISNRLRKHHERKRRREALVYVSKTKKKGGQIGRTWTQRKKGDIKAIDFSWWRLIHKHDVADLNSKHGKVS